MLGAAAVLSAAIQIADLDRAVTGDAALQVPPLTCALHVTGYRFYGAPGRRFEYGGESFELDREGSIELIAGAHLQSYTADGVSHPLEASLPLDAFGFRTIVLPNSPGNQP